MMIGVYVIVAALIITFAINIISGKLRFTKYLPGLILIFIGVFTLFTVINALFDQESIPQLVVAVIGISSGLVSLLFAMILGILTN